MSQLDDGHVFSANGILTHNCTPLSAFLTSGHPVFNRKKLQVWDARCQSLIKQGYGPIEGLIIPKDFKRLKDAYRLGQLKIYRTPEMKQAPIENIKSFYVGGLDDEPYQFTSEPRRYIVTADTAEGKNPEKGDFDVAHVYDMDTREQVAVLKGKWDPTYWGRMLAELGYFYFTALLAPEDNNHGHQAIAGVVDMDYPQNRGLTLLSNGLYYFRPEHINNTLKVSQMETIKPGWPTFKNSKNYAIDMLSDCIEDDELVLRDPDTINELMTFVNMGQGKMGGESGSFDDNVTCCWIAAALLRLRFQRKNDAAKLQQREPLGTYGNMRTTR